MSRVILSSIFMSLVSSQPLPTVYLQRKCSSVALTTGVPSRLAISAAVTNEQGRSSDGPSEGREGCWLGCGLTIRKPAVATDRIRNAGMGAVLLVWVNDTKWPWTQKSRSFTAMARLFQEYDTWFVHFN